MPTYVYQLRAKFVCPFTGWEGKPDRTMYSTTVFKTEALAQSRFDKFKGIIREQLRLADDYLIEVTGVPLEVIEE